jgi:hypothetical protein
MDAEGLLLYSQPLAPGPYVTFHNIVVFYGNIYRCPPYLEAISSICNLRMHHAAVTGTQLTWY